MADTLAKNHDSLPDLPPLPDRLDASKVFRQNVTLEGSLSLSGLSRLSEYLADGQGTIVVKLTFDKDEAGYRRIHGVVRADVNVECQRCLLPMTLRLEEPVVLALVASEETARQLPKNVDPWLMAPDDETLVLADIIEDQLILAMPIVSLHSECDADSAVRQKLEELQGASDEAPDDPSKNPFAMLASLKSDPRKKPN